MAARVTINGAGLLADPVGALYWPERKTLVVADLHFEKGSSFARRGVLLPPYDTRATLERLTLLVRRYRPHRIVCLGDSFHDGDGPARLIDSDAARLHSLADSHEWFWVAGNHDPLPPRSLGGKVVLELVAGPLVFRHQPQGAALMAGEVVGHFHPKATISTRGRRVTGSCFVTDGSRMILPALGAFTGGLDVLDGAISNLFGRAGFRVLLSGKERLHLFSRQLLARS